MIIGPDTLSLLVPVWQEAPPSLGTHSQSCTFYPSLVQKRAITQYVYGGGGNAKTGKGGRGSGELCIYGSGVMSSP